MGFPIGSTVSFLFGEDRGRISGKVAKSNEKTVLVDLTLPEDLGGKRVFIFRHIYRDEVRIES